MSEIRISGIKNPLADDDVDSDLTGLIFAGWFLDRLELEPVAFGKSGCECRGKSGSSVTIAPFLEDKSNKEKGVVGLTSVVLQFGKNTDSVVEVTRRGEALCVNATFSGSDKFSFQRNLENGELPHVLERFFLVGDSTLNYASSLRLAMEIEKLNTGYRK